MNRSAIFENILFLSIKVQDSLFSIRLCDSKLKPMPLDDEGLCVVTVDRCNDTHLTS
jgi:hypothetical protein